VRAVWLEKPDEFFAWRHQMNTERAKRALVCVAALMALTLGFYENTWKVAKSEVFDRFADQTESFIIWRLAKSKQDGILSEGGLIGREVELPKTKHRFWYQFEIYYNDIPIKQYRLYKSNPAVQGIFFSILDRCLPFAAQTNVKVFKLTASIISAGILTVFLLWVLDIFGLVSALGTMFLLILSPWLTVSGGHLYWIFGTVYLPFLVPLVLLHREYKGKQLSPLLWLLGIASAMMLKCLSTGFEFITTTLVMTTMPVFFYALWRRWTPRLFVKRFLTASVAGIMGALACAVVLSIQIAQVEGSMWNGLAEIHDKFILRTYPEEANLRRRLPQTIADSKKVPIENVIRTYLRGSAVSIPTGNRHFDISLGSLLLLFSILTAIIVVAAKNARLRALTITTWISILAPLSWFLIFKSHSVLHPFLDYLVWYMPTLLLLFTVISSLKDFPDKHLGGSDSSTRNHQL
jgi:hypothetical protein